MTGYEYQRDHRHVTLCSLSRVSPFSPGDSDSMVADGLGRMSGVLNGGAGRTEFSDVTYVTPMWWLWSRVQAQFPNAKLYPTAIA